MVVKSAAFEHFIRAGRFWTGDWSDLEVAQHHGLLGPWAPRERRLVLHTRYARLLALTSQLSNALGDLPHVILKGVTAGAAWKFSALRPQSDIDVLVEPRRAKEALERWSGLIEQPPRWGRHFHLALRTPLFPGVPIELHVGLSANFELNLDVTALLARRRMLTIDGHTLPSFDAGTELAYLALHAATHAGERLRWLFDLREKSQDFTDWDAVVAQALAWTTPWPVWWALREAKTRLGAEVPASVLASLEPPLSARARIELAASSTSARLLRLSLSPVARWPATIARKLTARGTRRR